MPIIDLLTRILIDDSTRQRLAERQSARSGLAGLRQALGGHFHDLRLYNPLGLAAGIVFFATIFKPWWYSGIYEESFSIRAYAFILQHDLPPEGLTYVIETPSIAAVFLLLLLCGYLLLAFWGSTMAGGKGRRYLLASGTFMLLYTAGFYAALLFACSRSGVPVSGQSEIQYTVSVDVIMYFLEPYYIAIAAGITCLASALVHGLITLPRPRRSGQG